MQQKKTEKILRVALYPRVSHEEQVLHGYSLEAQEEALVAYANEHNMKIVGIYRDEGCSARKPALKRPIMMELLNDVRAGKIDRILVLKLDRWFRNVREYHTVQAILEENKVDWQAIIEDYRTDTADGRLKINIMLSVAENEADRTSERIKFVINSKRKNGVNYFGGNVPPYGYKHAVVDGVRRLVKDSETEEIVNEFFRVALAYSIHRAYETVTETFGCARSYAAWYGTAKNELYTGSYKGADGFCEPYITKEQYAKINDRWGFLKASRTNRVYIFSGMLKCSGCGRRMAGHHRVSNGVDYNYYRCNAAKVERTCPNSKNISELALEKYLLTNVRTVLDDYILTVEVSEAEVKKKPKQDARKLEEQMRRLNNIYMSGNLSDDEYAAKSSELRLKIAEANIEQEERPVDLDALRSLLNTDFETIYKTLDAEDRRRLWRSIIKDITIKDAAVTGINFKH